MSSQEGISVHETKRNRFEVTLDAYLLGLSFVMMVLGLRAWAAIVGLLDGPDATFLDMSPAWKIALMHMAVVDPIAAVGLWMRSSWGRVVWIYAALAETTMHTVFYAALGPNFLLVLLHLVTLIGFIALYVLASRSDESEAENHDI